MIAPIPFDPPKTSVISALPSIVTLVSIVAPPALLPPKTLIALPEVIITSLLSTSPTWLEPPYTLLRVAPSNVICVSSALADLPPPKALPLAASAICVGVPVVARALNVLPFNDTCVTSVLASNPPPYTLQFIVPLLAFTNDSATKPALFEPPNTFETLAPLLILTVDESVTASIGTLLALTTLFPPPKTDAPAPHVPS